MLSTNIYISWDKNKEKREHDYAITAWSLSLLPEICSTVSKSFDRDKKRIVESVIKKLHQPPCPNLKIIPLSETEIIGTY